MSNYTCHRTDIKDIVLLGDASYIGVPFSFVYTRGGYAPSKLIASYDGKDTLLNCRWGNEEHTQIVVPLDHSILRGDGAIQVHREWYFQDPDFIDGINNVCEDTTIYPNSESPISYSSPSVGVMRGDSGLSAYDIAVKHGFVGTEEEWLESLKPQCYVDENNIFHINGKEYILTPYIHIVSTEYSEPVISLSYEDAEAAGSSLFPTVTYSQTRVDYYNDGTTREQTITNGAQLKYSGATDESTGKVVVASSQTSSRHKVATVTLKVTMNGQVATKSVDIYQKAYVPTFSVYVGSAEATKSGFALLTDTELKANAYKMPAVKNTVQHYNATKPCFFLLVPQGVSLASASYTSGGIKTDLIAMDAWNVQHDNVRIDNVEYRVYGYRSGAISADDPLTFDYSINY